MRTTTLKIGNGEREAVLVAGGATFKIYSVTGYPGWVIKSGRDIIVVDEGDKNFKTVNRYVNLKYQPSNEQETIKKEFDNFIKSIAGKKDKA